MKSSRLNFGLQFLFCIALFPFSFRAFPLAGYLLVYGSAALYFFVNHRYLYSFSRSKAFLTIISIYLAWFFWFFLTMLRSEDYAYFQFATLVLRKSMLYLSLAIAVIKKHGFESDLPSFFLKYIINATLIYILGTVLFTIFPSIKAVWFSMINIESHELMLLARNSGYMMRVAWNGFAGFRSTLMCCIAVLFTNLLFIKKKISVFYYSFSVVSLFLGNLFYGRSGAAITVVLSLTVVFIYFRKFLKYFIVIGLAFVMLYLFIPVFVKEFGLGNWYYWAVTPFVNLFNTGHASNRSVNILESWYQQFNPSISTFIFGDGIFSRLGRLYTDVGWMRLIYQGGVIGLSLSYYLVYLTSTYLRKYNAFIPMLVMILMLSFELKGDVYYEIFPFIFGLLFMYHTYRDVQMNFSQVNQLEEENDKL